MTLRGHRCQPNRPYSLQLSPKRLAGDPSTFALGNMRACARSARITIVPFERGNREAVATQDRGAMVTKSSTREVRDPDVAVRAVGPRSRGRDAVRKRRGQCRAVEAGLERLAWWIAVRQ